MRIRHPRPPLALGDDRRHILHARAPALARPRLIYPLLVVSDMYIYTIELIHIVVVGATPCLCVCRIIFMSAVESS